MRVLRMKRSRRWQNFATLGLVLLGPLLVLGTFFVLGPMEQGASSMSLRLILLADLVYVLVVSALVLQRIVRMIAARRAKSAGSRLHMRLTGTFALMALIPTISVAIFAALTINIGLEGWFSDRVRNVVGTSMAAARAYEDEHRQDLRADVQALAGLLDSSRDAAFFVGDAELRQVLSSGQTQIQRGLREAYVIDGGGEIRARGERSYLFDYEEPSRALLDQARDDGLAIIEDWDNNEFRAIIPLERFPDRYLYVTREVDGEILNLLDDTQATVRLYQQLENERGRVLFEFALLYLGFALILIMASIWLGLWFAERLSRPVGRLTHAAQKVGSGDLDVQVYEEAGDDEIAMLGRYFNQMTLQLKGQREALLENTAQIEARRRLFDSVLSSVTSGVVGLDATGRVTFVNRSAERLLDWHSDREALPLAVAVPEFGPLFEQLLESGNQVVQEEIPVSRNGQLEHLLVRMAKRRNEEGTREGYVVAFDDVTDLVSAQRMAAWGDVARRIAHEIKNPLTPIKLSAERIRRKFGRHLDETQEADLENLTEVIVRQTDGLRRIVDEFSKFARMPEPKRRAEDLGKLVRDAVVLQKAGQPDVTISDDLPAGPLSAELDANMIGQALTNLIKNAGEAIETRAEKQPGIAFAPEIRVTLEVVEQDARREAVIRIADNGIGLPEDRSRLFEPYVTTREKGTGLGLPIVKKIIEEHGGSMALEDAPDFTAAKDAESSGETEIARPPAGHRGAMAVIRLPLAPVEALEHA